MSWMTEYLREDTCELARVEDEHPYLSALLSGREDAHEVVGSRTANWLAARHAEATRRTTVHTLPYHYVVDPSTVCNLRCPLCVQATAPMGRRRNLLAEDDFHTLLDSISATAIRVDLFNWGEPLLNPHFSSIVHSAEDRALYVRTSTNLSLSEQHFDAEQIVRSGLARLVASIDGATQETYEKYRVRGKLGLVLRNLQALVRERERQRTKRPLIEWQTLVLRSNATEIEQCEVLAREMGADVLRYGGARVEMATKLSVSPAASFEKSRAILVDSENRYSEYDHNGAKRRVHELGGCHWLWGKVSITPDGGVAPCISSWFSKDDLGNWLKQDIRQIWHGPAFRLARQDAVSGGQPEGSLCARCAYHLNFVPSPDCDEEEVSCSIVDDVATRLEKSGKKVSSLIHRRVADAVGADEGAR